MKKGSQGSGGKLNLSNSSSGKKFSGSKKIESYTSLNEEDEEPIKSFRATKWRWVVLIIGCVLLIGSYFCYDMPNSLSDLIEKYITHETDSEVKYNQLYSIYSYPNIILPLFGGMLIDKIGIRFSLIFFTCFLVVGQGVFMFSGYMESTDMSDNTPYYIALAGRIIFGMGAETLGVVQNTLIAKWFMGKELSLALGIDISIGRFGNVMNNYITPPVGAATSLGFALMIGFVLCILSLICALITICFEGHAAKIDKLIQREENSEDEEEFHWSDLKQLGWTFWCIAFFCCFIYVGLFCFNNISNEFFMSRYGFSQTNAARITGNVFLISVFLAPLFGYLSDRIGHKVTFTILSGLSLTLCHALYVIIPSSTPQNISYLGIIPICLMGFTYSLFVSSLWPMVPLCVKPQVVGTAYGVCNVFQNIGLALGPIMVGSLTFKHKNEDRYIWVNIALGGCCFLAFLSAIGIWFGDKFKSNGLLQKPRKGSGKSNIDILSSPISARKSSNLAFYSDFKAYLENRKLREKVMTKIAISTQAK